MITYTCRKCEYMFYFSWSKFDTTKVRKLTEILFQPMPVRLGGYNPRGVAATRPALSWNRRDSWWRHQMETFSALLAICAGNSPVPGEFPSQRPVTWGFDVFFDLRLNKRLSKQSWGWWFETLSRPLWRHSNVVHNLHYSYFFISNIFIQGIPFS